MNTYPCKCFKCRKITVNEVVEPYVETIEHDGRAYEVSVPDLVALVCTTCGNRHLEVASQIRISEALRRAAGLLTPSEIRGFRAGLGLTQKALAEHLKIGEATLSRWETGAQIQQRSLDLLMRVYFKVEAAREYLANVHNHPQPPAMETSKTSTPKMVILRAVRNETFAACRIV